MPKKWNDDEVYDIVYNPDGLTDTQLAERYGVTKSAVRNKRSKVKKQKATTSQVKRKKAPPKPKPKAQSVPTSVDLEKLLDKALISLQNRKKKEAERLLNTILGQESADISLRHVASNYLKRYFDNKKNIKGNIVDADMSDFSSAVYYYASNNFDEALQAFEKAIANRENEAEAHYYIASIHARYNRLEDAISRVQKAVCKDERMAQYAWDDIDFEKLKDNQQFLGIIKKHLKEE